MGIDDLLTGLGLAAVFEGLALVLLGGRLDDYLAAIRDMPSETRRLVGLGVAAAGVALVYAVRA